MLYSYFLRCILWILRYSGQYSVVRSPTRVVEVARGGRTDALLCVRRDLSTATGSGTLPTFSTQRILRLHATL